MAHRAVSALATLAGASVSIAISQFCRLADGWQGEHIPDETDLVLVELGIQDLVRLDIFGKYEQLIRGLLELPSKPAVINVESVV